jgi:hypothetical protein
MRRYYGLLVGVVLAVGVWGCTKTDTPTASISGGQKTADPASGKVDPALASDASPATVVSNFLEAMRTGNDERCRELLSPVARQKAIERKRSLATASDTAKFEIGKVEYIGEDLTVSATQPANCTGARVSSSWTDIDGNGKPSTDHAIWITRREPEGWRVVGVAAVVFENEPPLLLNFEDPEEVDQKQKWLNDELAKRNGSKTSVGPETPAVQPPSFEIPEPKGSGALNPPLFPDNQPLKSGNSLPPPADSSQIRPSGNFQSGVLN